MAITNTDIGSVNTPIYTSTGTNAITTVIVCNTAVYDPGNPLTGLTYLYLYAVPSGSATTDTQLIVNKLPIPAGETVFFSDERIVLRGSSTYGNDQIRATASTGNLLSITVSALPV